MARVSAAPAPARLARGLRWSAFALALALASLFLAWRALAAVDFAYPVLYDALGLGQTIERYGPRNEVRPGFHRTDRAERERVFAAIAHAVRHGGEGLAQLEYFAPDGRVIGRVLTRPEIRHLRDVAGLVAGFERLGWIALAVLAALTLAAALRRERPPPPRVFAVGTAAVVGGGALGVLVAGPKDVFYWLHERIFPPDHPWFFYYEESLMSMMMRAPDLFGAIAAIWVPLALAAGGLGYWGIARLLRRRAGEGGA